MTRWKAAGIHLALSVGVVGALGALMLSTWYAKGLFHFAQGDRLLFLVAVIDVTVGPLLTLIVFKAGKKSLKFDLGFIALAQIAFLIYGLQVVWETRPAFMVALPERVTLVFAHEVAEPLQSSGNASAASHTVPWFGPDLVGARRPFDIRERARLTEALMQGRDLPEFPEYYRPFGELAKDLLTSSESIEMLGRDLDAGAREQLHRRLRDAYGPQARWVPITSSRGVATLFIDPQTAHPVRIEPIPPV